MTDEELVKALRDFAEDAYADLAADRIEALTEQLEQLVAINEAARADAKEAEAYAEELEREIELNEQEACMVEDDLIKADKEIDDLKAKLAKAVEGLREIAGECGCSTARATLAEIKGDSHE